MLSVLHATSYNDVSSNGDYFRVERENLWLTKRITSNGDKRPSSYPKYFKLGESYNPDSLEKLYPILETLGNDPKALAVRYKFINYKVGDTVQRIAKLVESMPSHIVAMDIDELDLPPHLDANDIRGQGEFVCNILHKCNPEIFPDDMGFIAQGSSSAGLTKAIKLHLWICNYDKLDQAQLRNLFYNINGVFKVKFELKTNLIDPALYHTVQAHYTAYPIFENPAMDPIKHRTVFSFGNNSYIPEGYSPYVKPVETTEAERTVYLDSITGGTERSKTLDERISNVLAWNPTDPGLRNKIVGVYHTAIQDQYCLETLRRELTPLIELIRPGESNEYIRQGVVSAVNNIKACSIRELPVLCKGLPLKNISGGSHDKFLDFQEYLPEDCVTFLKATLGTGKTHSISAWLNNGKITGKFLALTDTAALVESNAIRFKAGDFRVPKARLDFATGRSDRLSGTLHSLLKIKDLAKSFDFLFIDEADSLLNNLLFASIIEEETKAQIVEILSDLLIHTNRVVISDGDISEETVACYIDLMKGRRELRRVNHQRQNLKGVTAYKHTKESSLWGALQGHLELGDKCLVVSDSSPKALNEYLGTFKRVLPNKVIKVVHSAAKMDDEVVDIINNTTKALHRQEIDALLCSPSVTNGVDFNYFDTVFVITNSENHTPNMRFQAMMRERDPETIHYYFANMKMYSTGYNGLTLDTGWTAKAREIYAVRREREYKTYIATFNYYLVESGAKVMVVDVPYESPKEAVDAADYELERISAILNAKDGKLIPRHNDAFEMQTLMKFYFDIEEEPTWDQAAMFVQEKPHKKAEFLHKIFKEYWPVLSLCDPGVLAKTLRTDGYKFYLATGESLSGGVSKAKQILSKCGIKTDTDQAIAWYKKYCEYTSGVELPDILKEDHEIAADL